MAWGCHVDWLILDPIACMGAIGAGEMNRTPDLRITNALLYQLSYTGFGGAVAAILLRATHWYYANRAYA